MTFDCGTKGYSLAWVLVAALVKASALLKEATSIDADFEGFFNWFQCNFINLRVLKIRHVCVLWYKQVTPEDEDK